MPADNVQRRLIRLARIRGQDNVRLFQHSGCFQRQQLRVPGTDAHAPELSLDAERLHCLSAVLHKNLLNGGALAQALQNAANAVALGLQPGLPGVFIPGHIILSMVTGNQHKRCKNNLFYGGPGSQLPLYPLQSRIALYCTHKNILLQVLQILLQLTIGRIGKVGRSVSHQHQCLIRCPGRQPREQRI